MAGEMQIRGRMLNSDTAEVKVLISHVMEPGTRKDPNTKALIPAHHITEVTAQINNKTVLTAQWSGGISKNPFIGFKVKGAKAGDFVRIKAIDNKGGVFEQDAIII